MKILNRRNILKNLIGLSTLTTLSSYSKPSHSATLPVNTTKIWEFIVTDTTIVDHGDPDITGSIAWAIGQAVVAGGGVITIGIGRFIITSQEIQLVKNCSIKGVSKFASIIVQLHPTAHALNVITGTNYVSSTVNIENLSIQMSDSPSSGDAINLTATQAGGSTITSVRLTGGSSDSWGITNHGNNNINYTDILISHGMNGVRWITDNKNAIFNYGDCYINGLEISLRNDNTTGIYIAGTTNASVNNINFNRVEIATKNYYQNTTGLHLSGFTARNSFVHMDFENLSESLRIDSNNCLDNAFIHMFYIGDKSIMPTKNTQYFTNQHFIGGDRDFEQYSTVASKGEMIMSNIDSDTQLTYIHHASKCINNSSALSHINLMLPPPSNEKSYEFSIFSTSPYPISINCHITDSIINSDGTLIKSITSDGKIGRSIKIKNINYKYWIIIASTGEWI